MTNSQSVEQDGIVAGNIFAILNNANRGVNRMKFISLATVPYILPFVKTELGNTWYKFTCWKLHICNGQRKSWFCCSVSPLIATNIDMTVYPAQQGKYLPSPTNVSEMTYFVSSGMIKLTLLTVNWPSSITTNSFNGPISTPTPMPHLYWALQLGQGRLSSIAAARFVGKAPST